MYLTTEKYDARLVKGLGPRAVPFTGAECKMGT